MEVVSRNGADFKPVTQAETFAAVAALEGSTTQGGQPGRQADRLQAVRSLHHVHPAAGRFYPSELRGPKKTMMMAQRLYEAGLHHRICVPTPPASARGGGCGEDIGEQYGAAHLPSEPNLYGAKANAQEAHG